MVETTRARRQLRTIATINPVTKMERNETVMGILSEMPSWIKCVSVWMRVVTSPAPILSKKATFWRRMACLRDRNVSCEATITDD